MYVATATCRVCAAWGVSAAAWGTYVVAHTGSGCRAAGPIRSLPCARVYVFKAIAAAALKAG